MNRRRLLAQALRTATLAAGAGSAHALPADAAGHVHPAVTPGRVLTFPRDFGAHPAWRTEWWYVTGWLRDGAQALGVQVTFFRARTRHPDANPSRFAPRELLFARELWIERDDFMAAPSKGYFRLYPGNRVRLRYGYVVECTGFDQDEAGRVTAVHCNYFPDSHSGSAGADQYKVKGNVHWVAVQAAIECEVRLYDRLFAVSNPGAGDRDFLLDINPDAKRVIRAQLEPELQQAEAGSSCQFERHGYFVADRVDSKPGAPVFNRTVTLRDSWAKASR